MAERRTMRLIAALLGIMWFVVVGTQYGWLLAIAVFGMLWANNLGRDTTP